jgi:hypothetical protein
MTIFRKDGVVTVPKEITTGSYFFLISYNYYQNYERAKFWGGKEISSIQFWVGS